MLAAAVDRRADRAAQAVEHPKVVAPRGRLPNPLRASPAHRSSLTPCLLALLAMRVSAAQGIRSFKDGP